MAMMVAKIKAMPKLFAGLSWSKDRIFTKIIRVQHLS
jgi:hypothetical protein